MSYTQQARMLSTQWDAADMALHDGMLATRWSPARQGHDKAAITVERTALVRYVGQSYAVEVPFAMPLDLERLGSDFRHRHREIYGYATDEHWEMQSLRARGVGEQLWPDPAPRQPEPTSIGPAGSALAPHDTPRHDRDLPSGA
jgi:N-methylhydantoinase A